MPRPRHDGLTQREEEVLTLLREGLTNEQISSRLGISFETAKHHVSQVLAKLGVATREEAAAWRPEAEAPRWTPWRIAVAIGGTAVFAAAVAGLALLAWGVSESSDAPPREVQAADPTSSASVTPRGTSTPGPNQTSSTLTPLPSLAQPGAAWSDCAITTNEGLVTGIHVLDASTCEIRLVAGTENAYAMAWSPDGEQMAFLHAQGDISPVNIAPSDLFLAQVDGSGTVQLTNSPGVLEGPPKWSANGAMLLYSRGSLDPEEPHSVIVRDVRAGTELEVGAGFMCLAGYDWSDSGTHILVSAGCPYSAQYVSRLDVAYGGEASMVPGVRSVMAVEPGGSLVAFSCDLVPEPQEFVHLGLCIGAADGSHLSTPVLIDDFGAESDVYPVAEPLRPYSAVWTSDGSMLAVVSSTPNGLFLFGDDGTPKRSLINWGYSFLYWASEDVIVTSSCRGGGVPCGPLLLTSYRLDNGEAWEAYEFSCGAGSAGVWSPEGSRLAITTAQFGGCL